MQLIPIDQTADENKQFMGNPNCSETLYMSMEYYTRIGFEPPWICYFALLDRTLVGSAGFKGRPRNGKVEIAYGTFEKYQGQGIGKKICGELVRISLIAAPNVRITARTLSEEGGSAGILKHNRFRFAGKVIDEEDGQVCEWEYIHLPE